MLAERHPKWVAQVTVGFQAFGRPSFSVLNVTIASHEDRATGFSRDACELVGFEVGVMDRRSRTRTGEEGRRGAGLLRPTRSADRRLGPEEEQARDGGRGGGARRQMGSCWWC
ncbi:hypothetical protein [Pseudonocardia sp. Ae717_Ps2]|uniref:hypothetical protein n=1 Tax=Pseudonocardia sp. Ae717_Ps2 TaxID=1885573 RepID=UPI0011859E44|nr:hypothetical protein [Pseudonocardia sp. Ae717_Ps2]